MSLTVTQRPSTTVSGETSKWNAVRNPVVYYMQRKDFSYNQNNNNGGFQQMQFTGVDISSSFAVGNVLKASTQGGFPVVTASTFSGGNTLVTTTSTYTTSSSGYVNNITGRPSYRVEVEVYDSSNNLLTDSPYIYSPTSAGALTIDVSEVLKNNLSPDQDAVLTGSTESFDDTNVYIKFYIKYTEVWSGSAESQVSDSSNQFFAVLGGMQIPSQYGGNIGEYVMWEDGNPDGKFLTKFTRLVMWRGYPFLVSSIISDNTWSDVYLVSNNNSSPADYQGKIANWDLNQIITDQTVDELTISIYTNDSSVGSLNMKHTTVLHVAVASVPLTYLKKYDNTPHIIGDAGAVFQGTDYYAALSQQPGCKQLVIPLDGSLNSLKSVRIDMDAYEHNGSAQLMRSVSSWAETADYPTITIAYPAPAARNVILFAVRVASTPITNRTNTLYVRCEYRLDQHIVFCDKFPSFPYVTTGVA